MTSKLWVTGVAGANALSPSWEAVNAHVPVFTRLTVAPETVHTVGVFDTIVAGRPEVAATSPLTSTGPDDNAVSGGAPNRIDCPAGVTATGTPELTPRLLLPSCPNWFSPQQNQSPDVATFAHV